MRRRYGWYLPLSPGELEAVWSSGIVSVDANVLLDLYRHHDEARGRILSALRSFKGRLWLTNQAAEEFIRNRTAAITNVAAEYEAARSTIKEFEKALLKARDALRGHRLVSESIPEALDRDASAAIRVASAAVDAARSSHPDFLKDDPILTEVFDLFDGAVGDPPSVEERQRLADEAKRRRDEKIPPGYEDAKKEAARADGDFLVWHELLSHAKQTQRPLIFVTSERKGDWWEIQGGRRIGARRELLEEAHTVAGQRVLILSTDLFIERVAAREGQQVPQDLLFEIRRLSEGSEHAAHRDILEEIAQAAVDELANTLTDEDPIASLIAETNASGYYADDVHITEVGELDLETAEVPFEAWVHFHGDQHDDQMWCGNTIRATVQGRIHFNGEQWVVRDGYEISAEIENDDRFGGED